MRYKTSLLVRFGDIDHAGVVYYPRFFNYLHMAFEDFFREGLGHPFHEVIDQRKIGFPIVPAESDFMKVLKYGDQIRIEVYLVRAGRSSLTFGFDVIREEGDVLCARARITNATIDRTTFKAISCPEDLKELFLRYYEPD
ncbi:MAG: acyl-CoA thioesterase [Deltaproteobacteria bacterium]|nr:acyl-CoA thioesterase [Deltaproteobacteria bacterium]